MEILSDFGPVYTETNLDRFPVEPFNTFSNFLFLVVVIYWYRKKKNIENREFLFFLNINLPLLLTGYLGGTLYHATRNWVLWMMMDVAPIYIISFFVSLYHWNLVGVRRFKLVLAFIIFMGLPEVIIWTVFNTSPHRYTMGYSALIVCIILPVLIDDFQQGWKYFPLIFRSLAVMLIALGFRILDSSDFVVNNFAMGTHWLWHLFGAVGCHYILVYMHRRSLKESDTND